MEDYRVQLDLYDGPMDLLLYLVRREELDVHDIPVARITEQYCRYVEMLRAIDINLAGDFLVMAAWLMEIKTRMLLPAGPPVGDETDDAAAAAGELADPRAELVRQLLAYKQFKDLAGELGAAAAAQALKFPRAGIDWKQLAADEAAEPALDIADVQVWDLFEAFGRLMEQTGRTAPHQVTYDEVPIHELAEGIVLRLTSDGPVRFEQLFEQRTRIEMIGLFLAILELIRAKRVTVAQPVAFGPIEISLRAEGEAPPSPPPTHEEPPAARTPPDAADGAKRRQRDDEPIGVTWIEQEADELIDQELRAIDQELRAIKVSESDDPTRPPEAPTSSPPPPDPERPDLDR